MPSDPTKLLGKKPAKEDQRNLLAARYLSSGFPKSYDWSHGRSPLPARTFGNNAYSDCTLASQANCVARFERIEQRKTVILPDQTVVDSYLDMTGGADSGWYELDAIKRWRKVGFTPKPDRTYSIDAFAQINTHSVDEVKAALWQFKLVKICFLLPWAWSSIDAPGYGTHVGVWDVGDGADFEPNSWGGHSMSSDAYDKDGIWVIHTWYEGAKPARQKVTWAAVQTYADEAYSIVDSLDSWRKKKTALFDLPALTTDVETVTTT